MRARYNDMLTLFVEKPLKDNDNREACRHTESFVQKETDIHIQCIIYTFNMTFPNKSAILN